MENANPWVLLIAGALLGWLAGWLMELLFFRRPATTPTTEQVDALNSQLASCQAELQNVRAAALSAPADVTAYEAQIASLEAELQGLRVGAVGTGIIELPTEPDNLEALEGIGPVMAARLREAGITNYARLARVTPAWLDDMMHIPAWRRPAYDEWIAQAQLAAAGDVEGLKALQDVLNARQGDNLTLIYGIGPAGAAALHRAGITSFAALAAADPDQLRQIAVEAGINAPDVDAWIQEAGLRAAGKRVTRSPDLRDTATLVVCPQDLSRVRGIGAVLETRLYAAGVGTFWELASLSDEELGRILGAEELPNLSLDTIKSSAHDLAEETGTIGLTWDGTPPDDLELIEGIGEEFERRLVEGGICTYGALATATEEELDAIIEPKGAKPDYASWIAQAKARSN
jgi:predicted flap endonuclease-1-like 5' DNA nuclease